MPCIDGVSLADLVTAFERSRGYDDPAGGYAGIVPSHFRLGSLPGYFLGQAKPPEGGHQCEIFALFCECGEAGCWPLVAHVSLSKDQVIWKHFSQPHRPKRDYSAFGPFNFDRLQYEQAVVRATSFNDLN
jgi:hypothetical protein